MMINKNFQFSCLSVFKLARRLEAWKGFQGFSSVFQFIKTCQNFESLHLEKKSQGQNCLGARNVSGLDMSQGWTCHGCLKLLLYKK